MSINANRQSLTDSVNQERKSFSFKSFMESEDRMSDLENVLKKSMANRNEMIKRQNIHKSRRQSYALSNLFDDTSDNSNTTFAQRMSSSGLLASNDSTKARSIEHHRSHTVYMKKQMDLLSQSISEENAYQNHLLNDQFNDRKKKTPSSRSYYVPADESTVLCYPGYYPSSISYSQQEEVDDLSHQYETLQQQAERDNQYKDDLFNIYRNAFEDYKYDMDHPVEESPEPEPEPEEEEEDQTMYEDYGYDSTQVDDQAFAVEQLDECPNCPIYLQQIEYLQQQVEEQEKLLSQLQKSSNQNVSSVNDEEYQKEIDSLKQQVRNLQKINNIYVNVDKLIDLWGLKDAIKSGNLDTDEIQQVIINYALENVSLNRLESILKQRFNLMCVNENMIQKQGRSSLAGDKDVASILLDLQNALKVPTTTSFENILVMINDSQKQIYQLKKDIERLTKEINDEKANSTSVNNELEQLLQHYHKRMDECKQEIEELNSNMTTTMEENNKLLTENDQLRIIVKRLVAEHPELEETFNKALSELNYNPSSY